MTEDTQSPELIPAEEPQPAPEPSTKVVAEPAKAELPASEEGPAPEPSVALSPEPADVPAPESEIKPVRRPSRIAWWPFITYSVLWVGLIVFTGYLLARGPQAALPSVSQDLYPSLLLAALVMTLLGPLLAMFMWFIAWLSAEKHARGGLFTISFVRASILTFVGVVLWYGVLVAVDAVRLGLITLPAGLS